MNEYKVPSNEANMRIDKVLAKLLPDFTRSQMKGWFDQARVQVNEDPVKANYRCHAGDLIKWSSPPENGSSEIEPENIPMDIKYEDSDILVVNKDKGMVVHPSPGHTSGTLVNALLHHGTELSQMNGAERLGIVHRLDKDTSGLLVVAKNDASHRALVEQLQDRTMVRQYEALVHGEIQHTKGKVEAPIGRDPHDRKRMTVTTDGRQAITHFRVSEIFSGFSYITCWLESGRTHQIRVHMKYIGHPLAGDPKYGPRNTIKTDGQILHACNIGFYHPRSKEWIEFASSLPQSFQSAVENMKRRD